MRFDARQNWALFAKAPQKMRGTQASMSTSSNTMAGSLPPNSRVTRLSVSEALRMMARPVGVEPVKAILSMPACSVSQGPSRSVPETTFSTPGGSRSRSSSPSLSDVSGVNGEGFSTMVLPATSAGAIFQTASVIGKFQGAMAATTPSGTWRLTTFFSGVSSSTSSGSPMHAVSFSQRMQRATSACASASGLPCSLVSSLAKAWWCASRRPAMQ